VVSQSGMLEKTITLALFASVSAMGYTAIADELEQLAYTPQDIAASLQARELTNALELFYLEQGNYPDARNEDLVATLYDAGLLQRDSVDFIITYHRTRQGYVLEVE